MKKIQTYLSSNSRNKILIYQNQLNEINPIDVGCKISAAITPFLNDKRLSFKVSKIMDDIFNSSIINDKNYGRLVAIKNLGILLEPELKFDILQLLDKHSRTNALFIQWDGEIENDNLYFLTIGKGQQINIKNLSHIII